MFQSQKKLVMEYYAALDSCLETGRSEAAFASCSAFIGSEYRWRGYHPFNEINDYAKVYEEFWVPLKRSIVRMQRRQDIFMAGHNCVDSEDDAVWVVSMGHLMGLFDKSWLGIAPTGRIVMFRYCEFNKVSDGKIVDTAMYFDIPHLMMQAGLQPFPQMTGAQLVQPGPNGHGGLLFETQPPEESEKTLDLINSMVSDVSTWQKEVPIEEELGRTWHDDMIWWGPTGIGATYTIDRYVKQHSGVFRASFKDRTFNGHVCRMAEGHFGGFFGWPNLTLEATGGFMGMPATGKRADMRVIDIYRRDGEKLAENWIFIDLLHFWKQQGLDILARHKDLNETD